jgi:hypothetical protein
MPSLQRNFQIRAEAFDAEQRILSAVIATETPVEIYNCPSRSIILESIIVSNVEVEDHIPLLLDHSRSIADMVGIVEAVRPEGDNLTAVLRFASGTPASDAAWRIYGGRFGRQVSVGYRILEAEEVPAGRSKIIKGRTFTAPANMPLRVVTRWRLLEISLVVIAADPGAKTRSQPNFSERNLSMPCKCNVLGSQIRSLKWPEYLAAGMKRRGEQVPENDADLVRAAISTVAGFDDVTGVLTSAILSGFRSAVDTTAGWVRVTNLPNFIQNKIAAIDVSPRLERVARGRMAPSVGYGLSVQGWRLARFGCHFEVDEQDLIDGKQVGVLALAVEEIGRAARRLIPDVVFGMLLINGALADGKAIFHADRGNYATAALADTALDGGLSAVANQVGQDEEGDPVHLGQAARYLTVPPNLFGLGKRLARLMATGEGDLIVRSESRLGAAGIVDPRSDEIIEGSTTNWLLSCPSDQAAGVVVGALDGKVEPTIRSFALSGGESGVGFDIRLNLACTVSNPKSLYFSTGNP